MVYYHAIYVLFKLNNLRHAHGKGTAGGKDDRDLIAVSNRLCYKKFNMASFRCKLCSFVGNTRGELRHHCSTTHITTHTFHSDDGRVKVTVTKENGYFTCVCGGKTISSKAFYSHKGCYFPDASIPATNESSHDDGRPTPTDTSSACARTDLNEQVLSVGSCTTQLQVPGTSTSVDNTTLTADTAAADHCDLLDKYNLVYRPEYGLLTCRLCISVLGKGFSDHMRRMHKVHIKHPDEAIIRDLAFSAVSLYWLGGQPLLPALDFVPVFDGFKCASCSHYGKSLRHVRDHTKKNHDCDNAPIECKVQTISATCCKTYFGVHDASSTLVTPLADDIAAAAKRAMKEVIQIHPSAEPVKRRNLFYVQAGWYPEPERADKYSHVDKAATLQLPQKDEADYSTVCAIHAIFRDAVVAINNRDFAFRAVLGDTDKRFKAFSTLQNDASINVYSQTWTKLVYFARNLITLRVIPLENDVRSVIEEAFRTPDACTIFELMQHLVAQRTTLDSAIIPLFIRFSCCLTNGRLMPPEDVSRLCAKVAYGMKLTVLEVASNNADGSRRVEAMKTLKSFVELDNYNVFSFVCRIQSLAEWVVKHSDRLPKIARLGDVSDIMIRGSRITADNIRTAYKEAVGKCNALLEELLLGLKPSLKLDLVHDDFAEASVGYRFMAKKDQSENEAICSTLLLHVLCTQSLRQRFVVTVEGGKINFNSSEGNRYLDLYDEYLENLLLVIHIGSGMPARATELETYTVCNGRSSMRTVYFLGERIFFHSVYSKTRSVTGVNKGIARFLNEDASKTVITDLIFVRPFATVVANFLGLNEDNVYNTSLFVQGGRLLHSFALSNIFSRLFYKYTEVSVAFSDYRQAVAYFARVFNICGSNDDSDSDDNEPPSDIALAQFGHSTAVADVHYGRHSGEHPKLRETRLHEFRLVSDKWHRFITHQDVRPAIEEQVGASSSSGRIVADMPNVDTLTCLVPSQAPVANRTSAIKIVSHMESQRSLQLLREFFRDKNAVFKSPEQRAAVENVLFTTTDIIAVLPTGCGKSLTFFLYSFVYPHLTSVVIVPTVSLKQDLMRRAEERGISSSDDFSEGGDVSLLFLTPEAAAERSVRDALAQLYCSRRLGRVFIDEFHLFSLDSEYRPHFRELPLLTFLPVPFAFTSATAPDWIVNDVTRSFFGLGGKRIPKIVRQSCNRVNTRYSIIGSARVDVLVTKVQCVLEKSREEDRVIIYVPSIQLLDDVKARFDSLSVPCNCYSGQLHADANATSFASWREGVVKLMVATSAFGMGIDYPHVRAVYCYGLPYSLVEFAQQTGRAGRDGRPADAVLIYDEKRERMKLSRTPDGLQKTHLEDMLSFASNRSVCQRRALSSYFNSCEIECSYSLGGDSVCEPCDVCCDVGQRVDSLEDDLDRLTDADLAHIDISVGQKLLSSQRNLANELLHFVRKYSSICMICVVSRRISNSHKLHQCPAMIGYCFKCFGHHGSASCRITPRLITSTCTHCYLPMRLGDVVFHPNRFTMDCVGKDVLKCFGLAAVHFNLIKDVDWLYSRDTQGMVNLWKFFVDFCNELV